MCNTIIVYSENEKITARFVLFGAHAETTTIGDDLGIEGEHISDADWFQSLPDNTYARDMTERVLVRCRGNKD